MHNGYHGTEICSAGGHGEWEDSPEAASMAEEAEMAAAEYYRAIAEAAEEWEICGLETICTKDAFISRRLLDAGYG